MSDPRDRAPGSAPRPARPITIVTGGARGIGAATVAHLARAGHDVVVGYRDDLRDALALVRKQARHLREQFAQAMGARITDIAEMDLAVAHLRVPETV